LSAIFGYDQAWFKMAAFGYYQDLYKHWKSSYPISPVRPAYTNAPKYRIRLRFSRKHIALSPGQTRKHCCGNIVSYQCFAMFPRVGKH
jgi:hypothetical protein